MDKDVLEFNEWKIHNERRIETYYLVKDMRKCSMWDKILLREYMKYLDIEKEESNEL